ncbi:DUF4367 domain-containing protein [Lachnospiraceae bacterium 62-26]
MKEYMDQLEQKIREEFDRIAKEEENALQNSGGFIMPEGKKEELYTAIREKAGKSGNSSGETSGDVQSADVAEMPGEDRGELALADTAVAGRGAGAGRRNLYAELSEEDIRALELGRKILEQEAHKGIRGTVLKKKKRGRVYIGLVAALVSALAIGVTSLGGAERVIMMVTQMVGDREVQKINSSEDNYVISEESEEEAYQEIKEELGIEPVKIIYKIKDMEFEKMEFVEEIQTAELCYKYKDKSMIFLINASYSDTSLGIDADDEIIDVDEKLINGCNMVIKKYWVSKTREEKYSAYFEYKGLEYCLIATMVEEEFELILNNLVFP